MGNYRYIYEHTNIDKYIDVRVNIDIVLLLISMLWYRKTHITQKGAAKLSCPKGGIQFIRF